VKGSHPIHFPSPPLNEKERTQKMKNVLLLGLSIVVIIFALIILEDQNESALEKGAETLDNAASDVERSVEGAANELQN